MSDSKDTPQDPQPRPTTDYEDAYFHDDDEAIVEDNEGTSRRANPARGKKPTRKLPPPKRRFYED